MKIIGFGQYLSLDRTNNIILSLGLLIVSDFHFSAKNFKYKVYGIHVYKQHCSLKIIEFNTLEHLSYEIIC